MILNNISHRRPKIVYWSNIPTPYMVDRFNALARSDFFDFEVWFNEKTHDDRSWEIDENKWGFTYRYIPHGKVFGINYRFPSMVVRRDKPDVIVMLHAEPIFILGWVICKFRGIKTGFRVLLTYDRWVKRNWMKDIIKRYMFSRVDLIETHGEDGKSFAMRYGVPSNKIFITTHTVDLEFYRELMERAVPRREKHRSDLGLVGTVYIYVGRLWWGKGVTYLLEAFHMLQKQVNQPVSLLLVGDGKEELKLRQQCINNNIENVIFSGFQQKDKLPYYYAAADVFVFPTLGDPYGLVVDEAMACSLPIVSTTAAGEIKDRVEPGVNGYLVPPEDSEALAQNMRRFSESPSLIKKFGAASRRKVESHTPEQWAVDFANGIDNILGISFDSKYRQ